MEKSEIRKMLWHSLDMFEFRYYLAAYAVFVLLLALRGMEVFGLVIGGIFPAMALWRLFRIFRKAGKYLLFKAKLTQPHSSFYRGAVYFTVLLEGYGIRKAVDTRPVFGVGGLFGPKLDAYMNKTVTIAYNPETEQVVVLGQDCAK